MKIVKLETFARRHVGLLRVTTDAGDTGWGQIATFEAADIVAQVLHRQVARAVLGADPSDIEGIVARAMRVNLKFPGSYICRAVAAVDTALWDLRGRQEGKPVWQLLGGCGDPVPVYGSSMRRDISPEDEAARMAALRDEEGYRAFKVRVGSWEGGDRDASPGRTERLIPTLRRTLGDDVTLHADANSCYSMHRALEVGRMLEDFGYGHFEEPCPYWEMDWTQRVTAKLRIPVAGGEQDNAIPVWERMVRDHVVDIVQPDVCYIGGVARTLRVARMAAAYGLLCTPHSANRSLVTVFTLHLWNAMPNHGPFLEFSIEDQSSVAGMFSPALTCRDGVVHLPDAGPGWGVEIHNAWLEDCDHQASTVSER